MDIAVDSDGQPRRKSGRFVEQLSRMFHSKVFTLLAVLTVTAMGYVFAPGDLALGSYVARIDVTIDGRIRSIDFPFTLGETPGAPVRVSSVAGGYTLIVEGNDRFVYQLGEHIQYKLIVLDQNDQPIKLSSDAVGSTLIGAGYEQPLPSTARSADGLTFSMRVPFKARIATALLLLLAALWLTEIIPLSAASLLIPVVIVVGNVSDINTVLQPFFHPIVVLFLAGFLMAQAMQRTGTDRLIALTILRRSSLKPGYLMLTMMLVTAFLSMWMSNTAAVAVLIPIALAVLQKLPYEQGESGFRRALILGIAYSATIGGIGSAIGTPANMLALTFLGEFAGVPMAFADWFAYGLPMMLIMLPIIWLYLLFSFRVRLRQDASHFSHDPYAQELKRIGRLSRDQIVILLTFLAVMLLWLTESWHGVPPAIIALGGALLLFFTQAIDKSDLNRINWDALLTFGGGLSIGSMLVLTGFSDWVALQLIGLSSQPPIVVVFLVAALTLTIGAFISNTACAAMLIPLAIPLAQILHIDPRVLVTVVAIASSIDFAFVIGTPPTMMAYSTGFFKTSEIFRRGIVLDLIGIVLLSFGVIWIWQLLGVITL
jgi:sodium-dependent dicarboxylate transporter 2/3/5